MQGEVEPEGPSESECRPYIEKALKELEAGENSQNGEDSQENIPTVEITTEDESDDVEEHIKSFIESSEAENTDEVDAIEVKLIELI